MAKQLTSIYSINITCTYVDPNPDKEKKHLYRYIIYPLFTFVAFGRSSPKL